MFEPTTTGCYRMDEFHPRASDKCRLTQSVPVVESGRQGDDTVSIDLRTKGGQWNVLGHFTFIERDVGGAIVTRGNSWPSGKLWVVDAFRFTRVSDTCGDRPHGSLITLRIVG